MKLSNPSKLALIWIVLLFCIIDSIYILTTHSIEYYAGKGSLNELQSELNELESQHITREDLSILLYVAVLNGNYENAKYLLKLGANPDYIAFNVETPLYKAVEKNDQRMVSLLLDAGADPKLSVIGSSPLGLAMAYENEELIMEFIDRGVYPSRLSVERINNPTLRSKLLNVLDQSSDHQAQEPGA